MLSGPGGQCLEFGNNLARDETPVPINADHHGRAATIWELGRIHILSRLT
jgi:hypothetical protein